MQLLAFLFCALVHAQPHKGHHPSSPFTRSVSGSYSGGGASGSYSGSYSGSSSSGSYSGSHGGWSQGGHHHAGSWGQWGPWHNSPTSTPTPTQGSTPWNKQPASRPQVGGAPYPPEAPLPRPEGPPPRIGFPAPPTDRFGASGSLPPSPNSVSVSECREGDKTYKAGDKWTPQSGCGRSTCGQAGKVTTLGCPMPEVSAKCELSPVNPLSPWPACCPQLTCQD